MHSLHQAAEHQEAGDEPPPMWWVNLGWLPGAHQAAPSFSLLSRAGGENEMKKLVGRDTDREIAY